MDVELPPLSGAEEWSGGGAAGDAEVVRWLADDGAPVTDGQPILEVMLDKASVTVEAPAAGILRRRARPGDIVVPGDVVATVDQSA